MDRCRLSEATKRNLGIAKKDCEGLNESLFGTAKLRQFIPLLTIYPITCSTIENLDERDSAFHSAFDAIPRNLLNTPKQGLSLNKIINADLTLFCESSVHDECFDCLIGDKYCHVGMVNQIRDSLDEPLNEKSTLLTEILSKDIGVNFHTVNSHERLPPEVIAHLVSSVLNSKEIIDVKCGHTFYVVPGSFRIIAFNAYEIARKIKATRDEV